MRFDLVDLRLFCDVVEAGSITRGAERSALALAAASTRIRAMEQSLGAALLTRSRLGVTPTPAGLLLLKHARGLLEQSARMQDELGLIADSAAGQVRVLPNTHPRPPSAGPHVRPPNIPPQLPIRPIPAHPTPTPRSDPLPHSPTPYSFARSPHLTTLLTVSRTARHVFHASDPLH